MFYKIVTWTHGRDLFLDNILASMLMASERRHDILPKDTQHNDTQHKETHHYGIQNNNK
jgi:hypothetical protein